MLAKSIKYSLKALPYILKNRRIYPYYASFKLTDRCLFRCPFCNVWRNPAPELSTERVKKVLQNLADCSLFLVSMEGGEPLLRDDISEILEFAGRMPYFVLFTTSQRDLLSYPWEEYTRHIDFLHVSIDEGHNNLHLFDSLSDLVKFRSIVTVQTVVAEGEIPYLREKVEKCRAVGAKILVMPAVVLDDAKNVFPDWEDFKNEVLKLKKEFPQTVTTPRGYFANVEAEKCSSSSIIIDCDGGLFYPCRTLKNKMVNLSETSLKEFLTSKEAGEARKTMSECTRNCGWYQYFAIDVFTSPLDILDGIRPYISNIFRRNYRGAK